MERGVQIFVAAEEGSDDFTEERIQVRVSYKRKGNYVPSILQAMDEARVDLVHVQYTPDLFGEDHRLPSLLAALRDRGTPNIVTLHTVYGPRWYRMLTLSRPTVYFHKSLAQNAHLVVHHISNARALGRQDIDSEKVSIIPHGTSHMELPPQKEARARLGFPQDGVIFLSFGFIHLQKNLHTIVSAFKRASKENNQFYLVVAGAPNGDHFYNHLYARHLKAKLRSEIADGRVFWHQGFVPFELVSSYYSAADVVLLSHAFQNYDSVSGVFHQAIGAKRPVICAKANKFKEVSDYLGNDPHVFVKPMDIPGWSEAILKMVTDKGFRHRIRDSFMSYSNATEWSRVGGMHLELYQKFFKT